MDPVLPAQGRLGTRTLLLTGAAVPLTEWAVHALALHRQLVVTRKDPLTGLLRRDAYTVRGRRLLARCGNDGAVIFVDVDHFKDINDARGGGPAVSAREARLHDQRGAGRDPARVPVGPDYRLEKFSAVPAPLQACRLASQPSRLLLARHRVVDFTGRTNDLIELAAPADTTRAAPAEPR